MSTVVGTPPAGLKPTGREEITALRLRLLDQGYAVLRSKGKVPPYGWQTTRPKAEDIVRWGRSRGFDTTGTRLEKKLGMVDLDIKDKAAVDAIADAVFERVPVLADITQPLLVRYGGAAKEAWPVRVQEPFGVCWSRRWLPPGAAPDEKGQRVEIFGGAFPKFFALFGPHSYDARGEVLREYRWQDDVSLLDVPIVGLPVLTMRDVYAINETTDAVLEGLGWSPVEESRRGISSGEWKHDLTGDEIFECEDGFARTFDECCELVALGLKVRCSASFHDAGAVNRSRSQFGRAKSGTFFVVDYDTYSKHALRPIEVNMEEVAETLRRIQENCNG